MEKNYNIQNKVDDALNALETINEVPISRDFSSRVLERISIEKKTSGKTIGWFSPELQWAAMIVVLLVNALVIYYTLNTNAMDVGVSGIEQFAKDYQFYSESSSILN